MANDKRPSRRELWEAVLFSKTEIAAEHDPAMSDVCVGRYKPMKDAPKDGTAILALLEGSNIPLPIRWLSAADRMARHGAGWYITWDNYALQPADGPRGWLPIPAEWLPEAEPTPPIDMVLHCPVCHTQHIDAPDPIRMAPLSHHSMSVIGSTIEGELNPYRWRNPPHRSHLCKECGTVWRPADVPTNGVAAVKTKGKADHWAAPTTKEG